GALYPLFSNTSWGDGANTARCRAVRLAAASGPPHPAPDPDCTCGFYAYASDSAAGEYPNARHVLAVVACWGRVIAGTRGGRPGRARVEAIWMSTTGPRELVAMVRERYPSVSVYTDKAARLAEHPPTELDCYEEPVRTEAAWLRFGRWLTIVGAVILGMLPAHWLGNNRDARIVWGVVLAFFVVAAVLSRRRQADLAARRRGLVAFAVA